jgi:hypothetical protein
MRVVPRAKVFTLRTSKCHARVGCRAVGNTCGLIDVGPRTDAARWGKWTFGFEKAA